MGRQRGRGGRGEWGRDDPPPSTLEMEVAMTIFAVRVFTFRDLPVLAAVVVTGVGPARYPHVI